MSSHTPDISQRYCRQEQVAWVGPEGQQRLRAASVAMIGVGGLGSWVSELLVRAGVGRIRLVDPDRVDFTNLARQAMYCEADAEAGRFKAEAAAGRLSLINRDVHIDVCTKRLASETAEELLADVDLILDGTDDWGTRFLVNDYAVRETVPWVFAGVVRSEGQVMCVRPGESACLRCVFEDPPDRETEQAHKAAAVGVLGPAVAAIASLEAMEAIKLLAMQTTPPARLVQYDFLSQRVTALGTVDQTRREDCPCCGRGRYEFLEGT